MCLALWGAGGGEGSIRKRGLVWEISEWVDFAASKMLKLSPHHSLHPSEWAGISVTGLRYREGELVIRGCHYRLCILLSPLPSWVMFMLSIA